LLELARELGRRNRLLAAVGAVHAALAVVALLLMPLDGRTILGVSPWLKPFKFMVSIAIFLWTVAWLLEYLRDARRLVRVVSAGISVAMILETAALWTQSARGVTSHFNNATPFDRAVFGWMGIMILVNSLFVVAIAVAFFVRRVELPPAHLWGIRLGLIVFLLGSAQGMLMIRQGAHAVGVADGGAGLPIVNWSTEGGDLRVAHALGLHALQLLPLAGYLIARLRRSAAVQLGGLAAITLLYVGLMAGALLQAQAGIPLL
jgi:hypothetical protein